MKLISLVPLNIRKEAEEKEKPAKDDKASEEGGEDKNPFAASGDSGEASSEEGGDAAGGEEATEEPKTSEEAKPLEVVFNPSKVRKYNDRRFKGNRGVVTNISRHGLTVKLPDERTVFVNFGDIL